MRISPAIALIPALALALCLLPSDGSARAPACPEGGVKINVEGPSSFECPELQLLTGICVKAGRKGFGVGDGETENGAGCYEYEGIGGASGSVSGGGTSRSCKEISHSVFYCSPGEPEPPVCGDGEIEGDEQCDPPGRIDEILVCNEQCQLVEVPLPEPEPVCGNGKVEGGEQCDAPGRIDELFVCTEQCEIVEEPGPTEPPAEEPR